MITLYSKNQCPFCVNAKNYLQSRGIDFREINIEQDQDAKAFIQQQGHRTVPQIYMDGKIFVEGGWTGLSRMSREEILEEVNLRLALSDQKI